MSRAGLTSKPCPGCGEGAYKDGVYRGAYYRHVDKVCPECQALIEEAKAARAAQDARPNTARYWYHRTAHWNPYYHRTDDVGQAARALQEALVNLVFAVGEPTTQAHRGEVPYVLNRKPPSGPYYSEVILLPVAVRDAIAALDEAIVAGMESTYRTGHAEGSSLLRQLASGGVGLEEFNERALRAQGKGR